MTEAQQTQQQVSAHSQPPASNPEAELFYVLQSPEVGKLAEALAKAQGEIDNAFKDSDNPFFKSKYAPLSSVRNACKDALAKHGLSVVQQPTMTAGQGLVLATTLMHSSGQWMRSVLPLRPTKNDPQGLGSAITYMRRYALAAITGVAPDDDDDGNAASGNTFSNGNGRPNGQQNGTQAKRAQPAQQKADPKDAQMRDQAKQIQTALTNADSLDAVNQIWADYQDGLDEIKTFSKTAYDHLDKTYRGRMAFFANKPADEPAKQEAK